MGRAELLGPVLAPLGALFEHHVDRDQEEEDSAGDSEGAERNAERVEQVYAEQAEEDEDSGRHENGADRHRPPVSCRGPAGQASKDRRAAGRIDHHQEGDEGRDEQLDHRPSGGARPARACAAASVLRSSTAMVIGPTPPGTGVIAAATWRAPSKSTSPVSRPSRRFMPTSITVAPGFSQSPLISSA